MPTEDLPAYFQSNGIAFKAMDPLSLGFGHGNKQYQLYSYPGPAMDETMAVFCEWHTEDYFDVDSGPHVAIGILANQVGNSEDPDHPTPLFKGCPDPPGGPSFFIENFTLCDGIAPIPEWQLSLGQTLAQLQGNGIYRIDIHVSWGSVWAGVWKVNEKRSDDGEIIRSYTFLGQTTCSNDGPAFSDDPRPVCHEDPADQGQGNAFIGTGFSDPETKSRVDNIYIAHWKNQS